MLAWAAELLCSVALALLLRLFVVNIVRVRGQSMLPTLQSRDVVLVWRLPYCLRRPRRGEVVICHYPGRRMRRLRFLPQAFIKRVVGLPGDTLGITDGTVHINGAPLAEPYLTPERCRIPRRCPARLLGPEEYFVMGDHRARSNDSRSVGPIRRRAICGHAVCILWPPRRAGKIR